MSMRSRSLTLLLFLAVWIGGILPLALYWPAFDKPMPPEAPVLRELSALEQWLVVATAFAVKPGYMLLSLVWIVWLWKRTAADLVALRWGLILFLGGEIACAVNYIAFGGCSAIADYLHSYGMAAGFSFIIYSVLEGVDLRLIKYSPGKDRCAALSLCRACIKYAEVPCGLRRLFSFLIPAMVILALMLPCADLRPVALRSDVVGSPQAFLSPMWSQLFESRYCAWASIVLLLISWAVLSFKRREPVAAAKIFFAAGAGPLGFGLMRLFLRTAYRDNLAWANIWEEVTELIFITGVGLVLWLFRGALFREEPFAAPAQVDIAGATPSDKAH